MATRNLPLNTWIVVEQEPSRERPALISTHDCQRAAPWKAQPSAVGWLNTAAASIILNITNAEKVQ